MRSSTLAVPFVTCALTISFVSCAVASPHHVVARQDPNDPEASNPKTPPTTLTEPPRGDDPFTVPLPTAPASCTDFSKPSDQCLNDMVAASTAASDVIAFSGGKLIWDSDHQCNDEQIGKYETAWYDALSLARYAHALPDFGDAKSISLWQTWIGPNFAEQQQRIYGKSSLPSIR